ncbi:MAG: iron-containing alcohol dehydrogenase family protein [Thermacetogeniaceae bacterium]
MVWQRECSWSNINRLCDKFSVKPPDFIIGVGGGRALDAAKVIAYRLGRPMVSVPAIAATCAAVTAISIIDTDEGVFQEVCYEANSPHLVLVDPQIIAHAPVRLLTAGIGDTLAKWFELEVTTRKGGRREAVVAAAVSMARLAYDLLLEHGVSAKESADRREVTYPLEQVIDANILLSGLASNLGGAQCRNAAAHSVYSGMTILPETHQMYHGEIVAFGILVQLMIDGKRDEARQLIPYYRKLGLPVCFSELGIVSCEGEWLCNVAKASVDVPDMRNMPYPVTVEMVVDALCAADRLGSMYRS